MFASDIRPSLLCQGDMEGEEKFKEHQLQIDRLSWDKVVWKVESKYLRYQILKWMMLCHNERFPKHLVIADNDACSISFFYEVKVFQCTLKNVNNCLNTNIYSHLETSNGQSFNLYLNVVRFFNTSVN